ncbi:MAG TPA: hypothetical protein VIR00_08680 [Micromonosporaceae bacterium]
MAVFAVGLTTPAIASSETSVIALTSLSFASTSVDATTPGTTVRLDWSVRDTVKKATNIWGTISVRQRGALPGTFVGPTQTITFGTLWDGTISVLAYKGDVHNSSYAYAFPVPQYATTDHNTWAITGVTIRDDASHHRSYTTAQAAVLGNTEFTATQLVDSTAPEIGVLSLGPQQTDTIDNAGRPVQVDYQLAVTEEEAGFSDGKLVVTGPGGQTISTSFAMGTAPDGSPTCGTDELGVNIDPLCDILVTFPQDAAAGTWILTSVELTDVLGNRNSQAGLALAPLVVTQDAVIHASGFSLSAAEVNNWNGPVTVQLSMSIQDNAAPVTSVVIDGTGCAEPSITPTDNGDGTVSIPVQILPLVPRCDVTGVKIVDAGGNTSVFGSTYDLPGLGLTITQIPDTPPTATAAALSTTSFPASNEPPRIGLTGQVHSVVGVNRLDMAVYDANGTIVTVSNDTFGYVLDGTVQSSAPLPALSPGTYRVAFTITDQAGLFTMYGYPGFPPPPFGELQFTVTP